VSDARFGDTDSESVMPGRAISPPPPSRPDLAQISVVITGVPLEAVSSVGGRPAVSACSSSTYAVASPAPPPASGSGGSTMHTSRAWLECARIAALTAWIAAGASRDASQPHSPSRSGGW
jgi:hypothetical protein